jgi:hypothetical protein
MGVLCVCCVLCVVCVGRWPRYLLPTAYCLQSAGAIDRRFKLQSGCVLNAQAHGPSMEMSGQETGSGFQFPKPNAGAKRPHCPLLTAGGLGHQHQTPYMIHQQPLGLTTSKLGPEVQREDQRQLTNVAPLPLNLAPQSLQTRVGMRPIRSGTSSTSSSLQT